MPSRAVRPQVKGTEALMPASVALRGAGTLGSGVAKPQVKHLIGVSDPHRLALGSNLEAVLGDGKRHRHPRVRRGNWSPRARYGLWPNLRGFTPSVNWRYVT